MTTIPLSLKILLEGQPEYFREKGWEVFTASGSGPEAPEDPHHTTLPLTREMSPLRDLRALLDTWRWLRRIRPDILHTHTPKAGLIGMVAGRLAGVPVRLHTVAGLPEMEATGLLKRILRWTERITAAMATRVYANSRGLMEYLLREKLVPQQKLSVIGEGSSNGIDTEHFRRSGELALDAAAIRSLNRIGVADTVLVFVGRLDDHKGLGELKEAFAALSVLHPDLFLLLVGPVETARGGLSPEVLDYFEAHPRAILTGFQPDIRPWLAASDILVFPSYREGFPNVPLQAGAMELPSVVTNINGCNEIVTDHETGLLVPPKDAIALEQAVTWMLEHPEERREMGRKARQRIVERYERRRFWGMLEGEYLEAMRRKE